MEIVKYQDRLKSILVQNKEDNPLRILNVLKSDVLEVLKNYMELNPADLDVVISVDEFGHFVFNAYCKSRRLIGLGAIL